VLSCETCSQERPIDVIPIHLDPRFVRIGLIGNGELALRRYHWLTNLDCQPEVWSSNPSPDFEAAVGDALQRELPSIQTLTGLSALWIADLEPAVAGELANLARTARILVNVEDDLPYCDYHTPALVRRGQLLVSIGTSGASPAAAGFVRRLLEAALPKAWAGVLDDLSALRQTMRANGVGPRGVIEAARARLSEPDIAAQIAPCNQSGCPLLVAGSGVTHNT
jgi:precorrin-2 dehydrogenase / sirohydrochlorin ferrochelatase